MKKIYLFCLAAIFSVQANAQNSAQAPTTVPAKSLFWEKHAFYFSWGYNREAYTPSDLHFYAPDEYDFVVHQAKASDRPTFNAILDSPLDVTIPQYNSRIGMFLNADRTEAIEVNFDHTKYVVDDWQTARVSGTIFGKKVDEMRVLDPEKFLHFEHTNGANFLQINYVRQLSLLKNKAKTRNILTAVGKIGAGIVIPKTDVTMWGKELDNEFHVAGYTAGLEVGVRYYPFRRFFIEPIVKGGSANYTDVLTIGKGRANHSFWYIQGIVSAGYEWRF